ncbi:helix-turn-helix domain-containing protein [Streptomyces sp. NPDC050788]|uniref:helix-turn-helix domain-containing protein n=1 Tax=Streptomyces sp. NPDC050788 TaxID=3155041 RepID=UPI0034127DD9
MSAREEPADPTGTVRARVKELRRRKGLTAAELGEELAKLGVPWNRAIVTNFELGRRPAVSVQEVMALALVLDVAPVNLLVPLDSQPYRVTPEGAHVQGSGDVWRWLRGDRPLPGTQTAGARTFYAEVPAEEIETRGHVVQLGTAHEISTAGKLDES